MESKSKTIPLGMKQRLSIAVRCWIIQELIILDEPVNGFVPQGISDFRKMIAIWGSVRSCFCLKPYCLSGLEFITNSIVMKEKVQVAVVKGGDDLSEHLAQTV